MSKEVMRQALEAAYLAGWNASGEGYNAEYPFGDHARNPEEDAAWIKDRDSALREALAEQPAQQEPVAWVREHELPLAPGDAFSWVETFVHKTPLYTSPPAQHTWVELTNEEIENLLPDDDTPMSLGEAFVKFAILVEAKLKEKNT